MTNLVGPRGWLAFAVALAVGGTGCFVDTAVDATGDVFLAWSIDGDPSGAQCGPHSAALIQFTVTDPSGNVIDAWQQPCTDGATDENLPAGFFDVTAQLEDSTGKPITTVDPAQVAIEAGAISQGPQFDFPENSFTNGK